MLKTEKNRYLELNGDNVEHGKWKRHFTSVVFSTMVITQGVNLALNDNPINGLTVLPAQIIMCAMTRKSQGHFLRARFTNSAGKVIDTKPMRPNPTAPNDILGAYITKRSEIFATLCISPIIGVTNLLLNSSFVTFTLPLPLITESLANAYRMHKVTRGDWAIIDRDQMKKVEEREPAKTNLQLAPNLVPVKF